MKLGLGLYRHMLTPENFRFARQCACTHVIVHSAKGLYSIVLPAYALEKAKAPRETGRNKW
jgi:hypothetical protein